MTSPTRAPAGRVMTTGTPSSLVLGNGLPAASKPMPVGLSLAGSESLIVLPVEMHELPLGKLGTQTKLLLLLTIAGLCLTGPLLPIAPKGKARTAARQPKGAGVEAGLDRF